MGATVPFQNYVFTPAALAVGQAPPSTISDQTWLMVLSGEVALTEITGTGQNWFSQTIQFSPDMSVSLSAAIEQYSIPTPPPTDINSTPVFTLQHWSIFISLNAIFDADQSINAGYAVNSWSANLLDGVDAITDQPLYNIFNGVNVDVALSDVDAAILQLGFNFTLLGKIAFAKRFVGGFEQGRR
jgi:hypothetical protein